MQHNKRFTLLLDDIKEVVNVFDLGKVVVEENCENNNNIFQAHCFSNEATIELDFRRVKKKWVYGISFYAEKELHYNVAVELTAFNDVIWFIHQAIESYTSIRTKMWTS